MWQTTHEIYRKWHRDDAGLLAASVAYYIALSLFPVMMILISGLGIFLRWTNAGQDAQQYVLSAISEQLSPVLAENVRLALEQVQASAGLGGPLGAITLLAAALAIFAQFERAFDRIWNVESSESSTIMQAVLGVLLYRLRAFGMLAALGLTIIAVFLSELVFDGFRSYAPRRLESAAWLWWFLETLLAIGLNTIVFGLLYRVLPKATVAWRDAFRGGLVAAAIWEVGRQVLAAVIIGQRYTSAYGVVGSLLAIMLWGYYAVAVIFIGAEYIQVKRRQIRAPSLPAAPTGLKHLPSKHIVWGGVDIALAALILYLASFVALLHFRTYDNPIRPLDRRHTHVVIFSFQPQTQQLARTFFAPLIWALPSQRHFPNGDELREIHERKKDAQMAQESQPLAR